MADYAWPDALPPQTMVWQIRKYGAVFVSPFVGTVDEVTFPGWRWRVSLTIKPRKSKGASAGLAEAFFNGVAGADAGVLLYHWLRQVPNGTMRGTPVTAASAARGAQSVAITTAGTLKAGDLFKIAGTTYQCFADCAPVSGTLTVPLAMRVRAAIAAGAAVTWDRPTIRCIVASFENSSAYRPGIMEGTPIELEESP